MKRSRDERCDEVLLIESNAVLQVRPIIILFINVITDIELIASRSKGIVN